RDQRHGASFRWADATPPTASTRRTSRRADCSWDDLGGYECRAIKLGFRKLNSHLNAHCIRYDVKPFATGMPTVSNFVDRAASAQCPLLAQSGHSPRLRLIAKN